MRTYNADMATKPVSVDDIDVENEEEYDRFIEEHVLAEGDEIYRLQREDAFRRGIVDSTGNLIKRELPDDMRDDAGTDFGG